MAKILIVGSILIEHQYISEKVATVNQVALAHTANSLTSSKVINAGRILTARNEVSMLGCVGNDEDGARALADLTKYGIKTDYIVKNNTEKTGQVVVMTDKKGQSAITLYLGANEVIETQQIPDLKQFDYIYCETSTPFSYLYRLFTLAKTSGVPVFLDVPNKQQELDKDQLASVEFIVPNRHEAGLMLGRDLKTVPDVLAGAIELKKYIPGTIIISLDSEGCVAYAKGWAEPKHFPAKTIKVIDATAAGDIFRAVVLDTFLNTKNLEESIQRALTVATESVSISGVNNSVEYARLQIVK